MKVNVVARLEFELADLEAVVRRFSHYATGTLQDLFYKLCSLNRPGLTIRQMILLFSRGIEL